MGHDEMSCIQREYLRKRNTISFSVNNTDGTVRDDLGDFEIQIPPSSYPEHQKSQYGLFKLRSMYILDNDTNNYVANTGNANAPTSGFIVEISGLGIASSLMTTGTNLSLRGTNQFPILNKVGTDLDANANGYIPVIMGSEYNGDSVACGNPMGTNMSVRIYDMVGGELIPNNANLVCNLQFDIELLDF